MSIFQKKIHFNDISKNLHTSQKDYPIPEKDRIKNYKLSS